MSLMMLGIGSVASAHHSAIASYQAAQSIEIKGTVRELAWRNPHCFLYINVMEGPFKAQTYTVELGSPSVMIESGWARDLLQPGDNVAIQVHPSRIGAPVGLCRDCALTINGKVAKPRVMQ
jgi:hypothetical protein